MKLSSGRKLINEIIYTKIKRGHWIQWRDNYLN